MFVVFLVALVYIAIPAIIIFLCWKYWKWLGSDENETLRSDPITGGR